jgi:hypothetical protein
MSLRVHPDALPLGLIPPCLPTAAKEAPSGDEWLHEIKHDGYRVLARKDGQRIKLLPTPDLSKRTQISLASTAQGICTCTVCPN